MGEIKTPLPVKLFAGITYNNSIDPEGLLKELEKHLGTIEEKSETFDFSSFTDYYSAEMGNGLKKFWVVFREMVHPGQLAEIKVQTNEIEDRYICENKRPVNIDPGYLEAGKMILATTKNYSHRIYLAHGIYGDLHLSYRDKRFQPMPWTYPDYKQPGVMKFFESVRQKMIMQLREK